MSPYFSDRWLAWDGVPHASGSQNQTKTDPDQSLPSQQPACQSLPEILVDPSAPSPFFLIAPVRASVQVLGLAESGQGFAVKARFTAFDHLQALLFRVLCNEGPAGENLIYQETLNAAAIAGLASSQPSLPVHDHPKVENRGLPLQVEIWVARQAEAFSQSGSQSSPSLQPVFGEKVPNGFRPDAETCQAYLKDSPLADHPAWMRILQAAPPMPGSLELAETKFLYTLTTCQDGRQVYAAATGSSQARNLLIDRVDQQYTHSQGD